MEQELVNTRRKHEAEVKELHEQMEVLACDQHTLMVGQLAFENEAQIIVNVLQDCADPEYHIYNFEEMVDAIAGKETYIDIFKRHDNDDGISNLRKATEVWCNLKVKLGWKRQYFSAMRAVKNFRKGEAHLTLNLKEVEDAIKHMELTNRQMKSHCQELLKLY